MWGNRQGTHGACIRIQRRMCSSAAWEAAGNTVWGKREFTAEELSSFILRSLKEDAESFLGEEVTEAVISVPAYFNDTRRKATKRAGELAGLKVEEDHQRADRGGDRLWAV